MAGMASWWHREMIAPGKLPLMLCFLAFVVTFVVTRTITRMIRDGRGPFRNHVTASGTHIHHSVPGIILLIIGAFTAVGGPDSLGWRSFAAVAVGIGTSLVLDEFALILHLQDVYWSGEGQLSVEAVSLTAACLGLALAGFSPFGITDIGNIELTLRLTASAIFIIDGSRPCQARRPPTRPPATATAEFRLRNLNASFGGPYGCGTADYTFRRSAPCLADRVGAHAAPGQRQPAYAQMPIASKFNVLALELTSQKASNSLSHGKTAFNLDLFPLPGVTFLHSLHSSAADFLRAYSSS